MRHSPGRGFRIALPDPRALTSRGRNRSRVGVDVAALGEDDPDTLTAISNLAAVLWQMEEHDEAYWLQYHMAEALRRTRGDDDPRTRAALAILDTMQRDGRV